MKKLFLSIFLLSVTSAFANDDFKELTTSIYCPTCQGQLLDESNSSLAHQMKNDIRQMLKEGKTPDEIKMHFAGIYSEKVLLKPLIQPYTYLLWLAPFIVFGLLIVAMLTRMRFFSTKNRVKS
jgi:cytochrome c-type biogenesis protein CcmH